MSTGNIPTGGSGWEDWIKTLLPVVGSVAGGIADKASQDAANKANAQNVDKQIEFQREQAATAYQRAVADMRAAGLNPGLAYKQGGADTGSGGAADARAVSHGQRFQQIVDAYNQLSTGTAQRELLRAQAEDTAAAAQLKRSQTSALAPDAILGQNGDWIKEYGDMRLAKGRSERFLAEQAPEQYQTTINATRQTTATARQHADLMRTEAILNEQQFMNEWFRKNIAPYLNSTAKGLDVIGQGMGIARTGKGITTMGPRDFIQKTSYGKGWKTTRHKYY